MLRMLMILSFICSLDILSARPSEEPTKFILNSTQNNIKNIVPSRLEEAKELFERVADAIRIGRGRFVNLVILSRNIITDRTEQMNSKFRNNLDSLIIKSDKSQSRRSIPIQSTTPLVLFHPIPQEAVRLENETSQSILEKPKPDYIRRVLDSLLTPTPIVDRIKDEEKYGNTGDKFIGIGKAFVNGYETLSNFLNIIVDLPVHIAKQTSRGVTQTLNELGARIVGLQ